MTYLQSLSVTQPYFKDSNYTDLKSIEGQVNLREFLAGTLSYYPWWIRALYAVRWGFVRLLGMRQDSAGINLHLAPEDVSFKSGEMATIFKVEEAVEDQYWIASATDKHLTADLMVACESLANGQTRFHVGTIVHYHHWTGPVYFAFVRPFHHLVVLSMMRAGVNYRRQNRHGN